MHGRSRNITTVLLVGIIAIGNIHVLADNRERTLRVMTYNMYAGAEFSDIFNAQSPQELVAEVAEAYSDMQAGNVPERIDEIADQIAAASPDIVGLQEVAIWRVGAPFDPAPATAVSYDFLEMLLGRLKSRGLHYGPLVVQQNLDAELTGVFGPSAALDIRYTDRVAIIARTDLSTAEFKVEGTSGSNFNVNLPVTVLGNTITVLRGWTAADIKHRGQSYRFVNTHLESFYDPIQWAQAAELLQGPTAVPSAVVLAGDFNSDADAGGFSYQMLLGGGFGDSWTLANGPGPGSTWPLSGEIPSTILTPTQRLDLILVRGDVTVKSAELRGEDPGTDLSPSGFRSSDHAGVAAGLVLQP